MNKNKTKLASIVIAFAIAFIGVSCVNEKHDDQAKDKSKANTENTAASAKKTDFSYDLTNPVKYNMPQNLFEISGITFHNGDPKQVFAIQDEDGDLFHLGLEDKQAKYTKFGGKGDYEDLAILKDQVIILKSNGELHTFPLSKINAPEVTDVIKTKDLVPKAEYEGLAADEKAATVYVLTKEVKKGKKGETEIFAFKFDQGSYTPAGNFSLAHDKIAEVAGASKMNFRPSALAKNPKTGEWYVLSSMNKLLVITDENFKIKSTQALKGNAFNQPEGIAFDKDNNLYISNEGGTLSAGNILMFKSK
ncbi:SdiA-regulated domain-containing protein [Pedobacter sp. N23S346]|uniref:SdiA-regulated domain-containing protein n=1 Tax=Pedobacter sp. N23S346 TaxID=3402750 RepID=UPI003ACE2F55